MAPAKMHCSVNSQKVNIFEDMDLVKAQRLLNKIQAFLDNGNGHSLSRLEKDLIKSYVQQLYDAVTSEETTHEERNKSVESSIVKSHAEEQKPKFQHQKLTETHKTEQPKTVQAESSPLPSHKPEPQAFTEYHPPIEKEKHVELEISSPHVTEHTQQHHQVVEPVKETPQTIRHQTSHGDQTEALNKLFDVHKSAEISSRFGHVPIESIESAMGLNERIFTLNELFGGDKALFDAWCAKLNSLSSFTEAKNVLISGPALDFKWTDPERIKMAEQFIRIVSRRYPKSAS